MLKLYTVETAKTTILKRAAMEDLEIPETVMARTEQVFGERLAPAAAVERILRDIRRRGDAALAEWTLKLDGGVKDPVRVPAEELRAAMVGVYSRWTLERLMERPSISTPRAGLGCLMSSPGGIIQ